MEETLVKPGIFSKLAGMINRRADDYDDYPDEAPVAATTTTSIRATHRYHITVRRQIMSFQDAVAAADGLKRGEQQVLNLSYVQPDLREKIKDFMCGVNYTAEGAWEELGENVFLLAPSTAYVEVAPASPRMKAGQN